MHMRTHMNYSCIASCASSRTMTMDACWLEDASAAMSDSAVQHLWHPSALRILYKTLSVSKSSMTESTPIEPISTGESAPETPAIDAWADRTDALNLYRITHPDKEIRPLITRLHRLSTASSSKTADGDIPMEEPVESDEKGDEMELAKLDLLKWQRSVERIMGSVFNLQTQKMFYEEKAKQTGEHQHA